MALPLPLVVPVASCSVNEAEGSRAMEAIPRSAGWLSVADPSTTAEDPEPDVVESQRGGDGSVELTARTAVVQTRQSPCSCSSAVADVSTGLTSELTS